MNKTLSLENHTVAKIIRYDSIKSQGITLPKVDLGHNERSCENILWRNVSKSTTESIVGTV